MRICYVDEAGCTGVLPTATSPIQPVFVILGVSFDHANLRPLTYEFLDLKQRYFPGTVIQAGNPPTFNAPRFFLDWVLAEVKGAELRRSLWSVGRNRRRHAIGFFDHFFLLLQKYDARVMGRVLIKGVGQPLNGRAVYTSAIQTIFSTFHNYLHSIGEAGVVIIDGRLKHQNVNVAHSLFTQKFQASGDPHDNVLELPTFGHSENHIGLQIADVLCSGIVFPIATHSYCDGYVTNMHVQSNYAILRTRYGATLRGLQHRYQDPTGRWRGGIVVNDGIAQRPGIHLF